MKALGELCDITVGRTPARNNPAFWGQGEPWLSIADMNQGLVICDTKEQITPIAAKAGKLVKEGTVLLSFKLSLGKVAIAGQPLYTNEAIAALPIRNGNQILPEYLLRALQTIELAAGANRAAMGSTLNKAKLQQLQVPVPPLAEQHRIAAVLDHADALRVNRREALARFDDLSRSIFFDMFGNPIANPKGWPTTNVERICFLVRGSSPRPQGDPRFFGGPVPRLMISDITRDGKLVTPRTDSLTIEGAKRSRPCPKGTVVMAVSGNIGLASMLAVDACIHDGFVGFTELDVDVLQPRFLLEVLSESKAAHGKSQAGAIFQNITTTDIKALKLIAPPLCEQATFTRRIAAVELARESSRRAAAEIDNLFASLQRRAFSGQL